MNASADHTYVIFELAGAAYGLRSSDVLHVDLCGHLTPVPNAAATIDGVVFSRGQVVPALNLRARFGLPRTENSPTTRLIFVKTADRTVALVVDSAREFRVIPAASVRPVEATLQGIQGNYLRGVAHLGDRMVLLLDVVTLIATDAMPAPAAPALETTPTS
ncbi:MAG: chemotaxis protein CheW [Opitutus sp.]|nr:chemotaxis protein CheW [Opitutus sp.]